MMKRVVLKFCFLESHVEFLILIRERGPQSRTEAGWIRLQASKHSEPRAVHSYRFLSSEEGGRGILSSKEGGRGHSTVPVMLC